MRLGYKNVYRMPTGYFGWRKDILKHDDFENKELLLGKYFPECQFVSINRKLDNSYLGLNSNVNRISLTDIKSQYIYVALFNEMCVQCVEEMKQYSKLFDHFQQDKKLKDNIKIIGIGAGSTNRSAKKFVNQHHIPFPVFADKNWNIFKCLGEPPLPISYLLIKESDTKIKIDLIRNKHIQDISDILAELSPHIF